MTNEKNNPHNFPPFSYELITMPTEKGESFGFAVYENLEPLNGHSILRHDVLHRRVMGVVPILEEEATLLSELIDKWIKNGLEDNGFKKGRDAVLQSMQKPDEKKLSDKNINKLREIIEKKNAENSEKYPRPVKTKEVQEAPVVVPKLAEDKKDLN